ncbi:MAG: hypothetical protein HQ581_24510, partial [Planctomycetes bacterium]|nr:hypothetical protein [Planctomycetota bacterium]
MSDIFTRTCCLAALCSVAWWVPPAGAQDAPVVTYLEGHDGPLRAVAFTPDGKTLVSAGFDR